MMIKPITAIVETNFGQATLSIEQHPEEKRLVVNCFDPPCGGAGIFMLFNSNILIGFATKAMQEVINQGAYDENKNLTDYFNFPGLLALGTGRLINSLALDMIKAQRNVAAQ